MTRKTSTTAALAWDHAVHDIPDPGCRPCARRPRTSSQASPARSTSSPAASLRAEYTSLADAGRTLSTLTGRLRAEVSQTCVVTLEPVDSTIEEAFEAVFWPQEDMPTPESGELAIDEEPEREPIVAGQLAVGRVVFESLAAALDPFPRKPGAVLDWQPAASADGPAAKPASPFAVLANLKTKD